MIYSIDKKNWEAYRERSLNKADLSKDQKKFLKKQFSKAYRLMEKMIDNDNNEKLLRVSMRVLTEFFSLVFNLTGISATASNFIICQKEDWEV